MYAPLSLDDSTCSDHALSAEVSIQIQFISFISDLSALFRDASWRPTNRHLPDHSPQPIRHHSHQHLRRSRPGLTSPEQSYSLRVVLRRTSTTGFSLLTWSWMCAALFCFLSSQKKNHILSYVHQHLYREHVVRNNRRRFAFSVLPIWNGRARRSLHKPRTGRVTRVWLCSTRLGPRRH
jgi:hypothetical protein